ncbi:MAG: NADH-quinone oxidoreductase subunit J [Candidatus Thorarchaeota archaeon]
MANEIVGNMDLIIFIVLALGILLMAILVLEAKDMSHAIVFLAMAFVGVAGMFLLLSNEFLFAIQMTVYAGGVIILFLFALMLTRTEEFVVRGNTGGRARKIILIFVFFVFLIFFTVIQSVQYYYTLPVYFNEIGYIGLNLFDYYFASFIILGFIILVVLIGAVYLIKNEGEPEPILDKTDFFPGGIAEKVSTTQEEN